jgi:acyl carrier protein
MKENNISIQTPLEQEVAKLIVNALNLEDIDPGSINPESPLFNEGLGLDSIDALELSLVISTNYGFQIKSDDSNNVEIFSNLRSLSKHIENQRKT